MNPVGPEDPSTYWRRRAVVGVGLLVVVLVGFWLLRTVFASEGDAGAEPTPTPNFGLSVSPSPEEDPTEDEPSASAEPSSSAAATTVASAACADSDIEVAVATAGASTPVGAGMALTMTVKNTGKKACNRDLGAGANELRITSGSVLVWSSDFCNPSKDSDVQALVPGKPFTTSATWPGTVTAEGCPADQPDAQAGGYKVIARNGKVESEPKTFAVQ